MHNLSIAFSFFVFFFLLQGLRDFAWETMPNADGHGAENAVNSCRITLTLVVRGI